MNTFVTKTSLIDRTLYGEFVPKGTECVSFGYKKFMPLATWQGLVDLGGFEGKMWEHLVTSVGNNCRFRIERHSENDNQLNLVSIDKWRSGVKRMEVIHSWEVSKDDSGTVEENKWSDIRKDIWELPLFLRRRVTIDLGYSAKFDTSHHDSDEVWMASDCHLLEDDTDE